MIDRVPIGRDEDVTIAVVVAQARARQCGFDGDAVQRLGTAVSELARNVHKYAPDSGGDMLIQEQDGTDGRRRLLVQVRDNGPGIADIDRALQDHYSSSGTLGLGLPGVKRIVDEFSIVSEAGRGTVVSIAMVRQP